MIDILRLMVTQVFNGVAAGILFMLPLFFIGWHLHRRRRRFKEYALDPFTELPLRPPGESLRLKIESLRDDFDETLTMAALTTFGAAIFAGNQPGSGNAVVSTCLGLMVTGTCIWAGRRLARLQ